jgi:cbb3-type cytochrome oxidase maturation protein
VSVIFVLLPLALLFAAAALGVFIWAALSGQYDDVHTPAVRILYDDESAGHDDEPPAPFRQGP